MPDRSPLSNFTRREVLKQLARTPLMLRVAPFLCGGIELASGSSAHAGEAPAYVEARYKPHYPTTSDLSEILNFAVPGTDDYITEKYAVEIEAVLRKWGETLKHDVGAPPAFLASSVEGWRFDQASSTPLRAGFGIEVSRRKFGTSTERTATAVNAQVRAWLGSLLRVETAEFEVFNIDVVGEAPLRVNTNIRYDIVSVRASGEREERVGTWIMTCSQPRVGTWEVTRWDAGTETLSIGTGGGFVDVTEQAMGATVSYRSQMMRSVDYWRTVLDGAIGTDIYGNNGIAAGDFDNDGFDDLYVCQPAGLPNRLYRNCGDGTFEDVTEKAGVGVLDNTACALFADFENRGLQDLLVVCGNGPLLFQNRGDGTFSRKHDAFTFATPASGTFTHAALADYDGDGRLDIYFCTYSYYLGLDQYHYPAPYYDARNGPPNVLMHNEGGGRFVETTNAAGLQQENNRYSFACAWGDANGDGRPDLCIANDFGTSQLYRNQGDGTFAAASAESHVENVGAGMSATWCDIDNDGHQDIYISSMWEAAGQRVSTQAQFHPVASAEIREKYQRHARGNALYRNSGDGTFVNAGETSGTAMGRWSWSADFWDVDHDGYPDLYVTNGYISSEDHEDRASFFWRQVVAKSPEDSTPLRTYERGWNAINELVRSDSSWNSYERNVLFSNNGDGTFSEISGILGLDCREDSRAFALADLDGDGRLEVVLKNRNAPQLRVLHNAMQGIGGSVCFRLRGRKSNRDAIGAAITLETTDAAKKKLRQTRYLQAGTGFLSQHSKEVFFGIGRTVAPLKATVRWPSGLVQSFAGVPAGHRIEIEEGVATFAAKPFASKADVYRQPTAPHTLPLQTASQVETWLITPLKAPEFSLPDSNGRRIALKQFAGSPLLLVVWGTDAENWQEHLQAIASEHAALPAPGLVTLALNVGPPSAIDPVRDFVKRAQLQFPILFAAEEVAGVYNLIFRYLFDRRRDLPLPTSFLIDAGGMIVKVYQGRLNLSAALRDVKRIPSTDVQRAELALPFPGQLHHGKFQRNDFTYGVAMFQHGYFEEATASFQQAVASRPDDPEAYYNLGTLDLRRNNLVEAQRYLEKTVTLRADYPEAWNNLGMIAAQQGDAPAAVAHFRKALAIRPEYATALLNLGNLYRRAQDFTQAEEMLNRAVSLQPDDPEANYSLGMLHAQQQQLKPAAEFLQKAISLRPIYPDALNNLGIVYVRLNELQRAEEQFRKGMEVAPDNAQLYLNLARVLVLEDRRPDAKDALLQLLQRQPANDTARHALEGLR